jgi:hypothetical protein
MYTYVECLANKIVVKGLIFDELTPRTTQRTPRTTQRYMVNSNYFRNLFGQKIPEINFE